MRREKLRTASIIQINRSSVEPVRARETMARSTAVAGTEAKSQTDGEAGTGIDQSGLAQVTLSTSPSAYPVNETGENKVNNVTNVDETNELVEEDKKDEVDHRIDNLEKSDKDTYTVSEKNRGEEPSNANQTNDNEDVAKDANDEVEYPVDPNLEVFRLLQEHDQTYLEEDDGEGVLGAQILGIHNQNDTRIDRWMLLEAYRTRSSLAGRSLMQRVGPDAVMIMLRSTLLVYSLTGAPNAATNCMGGLLRLPGAYHELGQTLVAEVPRPIWDSPFLRDQALEFQYMRGHEDWLVRPPGKPKADSISTDFYDCTSSPDGSFIATVSSAGNIEFFRVPQYGHSPELKKIECEMLIPWPKPAAKQGGAIDGSDDENKTKTNRNKNPNVNNNINVDQAEKPSNVTNVITTEEEERGVVESAQNSSMGTSSANATDVQEAVSAGPITVSATTLDTPAADESPLEKLTQQDDSERVPSSADDESSDTSKTIGPKPPAGTMSKTTSRLKPKPKPKPRPKPKPISQVQTPAQTPVKRGRGRPRKADKLAALAQAQAPNPPPLTPHNEQTSKNNVGGSNVEGKSAHQQDTNKMLASTKIGVVANNIALPPVPRKDPDFMPLKFLYIASLAWHPHDAILACGSRIMAGHLSFWRLFLNDNEKNDITPLISKASAGRDLEQSHNEERKNKTPRSECLLHFCSLEESFDATQWITALAWCTPKPKKDSLPKQDYIAVGYSNGSILLWELKYDDEDGTLSRKDTPRVLRPPSGHAIVSSLCFQASSGNLVATIGNLIVWWKNVHAEDEKERDIRLMTTMSHVITGCDLVPAAATPSLIATDQAGTIRAWQPNLSWTKAVLRNDQIFRSNAQRAGSIGDANATSGLVVTRHGAAVLTFHLQRTTLVEKSNRRTPGPHHILSAHPLMGNLDIMLNECVSMGKPLGLHAIAWWISRSMVLQQEFLGYWNAYIKGGVSHPRTPSNISPELFRMALCSIAQLVGLQAFNHAIQPNDIYIQRMRSMLEWIETIAASIISHVNNKTLDKYLPEQEKAYTLALLDLAHAMHTNQDKHLLSTDQVSLINSVYKALGEKQTVDSYNPYPQRGADVPPINFSLETTGLQEDLLARDMYTLEELFEYDMLICDICGVGTQAYVSLQATANASPDIASPPRIEQSVFQSLLPSRACCLLCGVALVPNSHLINGI